MEGERLSWEEKGVWQLQAQEGAAHRGQRDKKTPETGPQPSLPSAYPGLVKIVGLTHLSLCQLHS